MASFSLDCSDPLCSGKGWIRQDGNYNYFVEDSRPWNTAIYTHAWNDAGSVLFTGGGPGQVGLFGCYGALWKRCKGV